MSDHEEYVLEYLEGDWSDPYETLNEAVKAARRIRAEGEQCAVLRLTYVFDDSELVDPDFDVWPPRKDQENELP